ncbi:hypothetical protein NDU88_002727 [Pleurodeles waltl]|uniref:Uncharacterized protein n=1 Tax=Pleurodeles waltl TaxID=8319 RepID=A0AAV7MS94_PLEWA|nr:hypothetical protein NDU88_002727 [Pleurodeles waltl]
MRARAKRQEGGSSSRPQQRLSPAMRECSLAFVGASLMCSKSSATRDAGAREKTGRGLLLPAPAAAASQSRDAGVLPGVYGSLPDVQQIKRDP